MKDRLRTASILLMSGLFLLNAACTTVKPLYDINQESFASQLKEGHRVRLTYLDGRVKEINVTAISETEIKGTIHKNTQREPKGYAIVADWKDIHAVETVKISAIKTIGAGVAVVVAIPFIALGALFVGAGS